MSQGLFIVYMQVPIIKSFECAWSCPQVNFETCWDYSHCSYYIPYHCQSISLLSCTSYPCIFNSCHYSWAYRQSLFCFKATNRPISVIDISIDEFHKENFTQAFLYYCIKQKIHFLIQNMNFFGFFFGMTTFSVFNFFLSFNKSSPELGLILHTTQ